MTRYLQKPSGLLRVALALLLALILAVPMSAMKTKKSKKQVSGVEFEAKVILRAKGKKVPKILQKAGLEQLKVIKARKGEWIVLVGGESWQEAADLIEELKKDKSVKHVEEALDTALPESSDEMFLDQWTLDQSTMAILDAVRRNSTAGFGGNREVWEGYLDQPAAVLLELEKAHKKYTGKGAVVAIIDTGIDDRHELFTGRLVPGYDFLLDQAGYASDRVLLDQSTMAILDQSTMAILDQSTMAILDQSTMAILDQSTMAILDQSTMAILDSQGTILPASLGHGTLVAGIVHRAAPEAKLMPLRVFDGDGSASIFDIIDAIRYAIEQKVTVINMSFHLERVSEELMRAIEEATDAGIVCVAAAGNEGLNTVIYPAADPLAIGVAATDEDDFVATFSNYGNDLVYLAAPGVAVITSWIGNHWAAASGTSFATPWISGAIALFADKNGKGGPGDTDLVLSLKALANADEALGVYADEVGFGRANLKDAINALRKK